MKIAFVDRKTAKVTPNSDSIFLEEVLSERETAGPWPWPWPVAAVALHWRFRVGAVERLTPPPPLRPRLLPTRPRKRASERTRERRRPSLASRSFNQWRPRGRAAKREREREREPATYNSPPPPQFECRLSTKEFDRSTRCTDKLFAVDRQQKVCGSECDKRAAVLSDGRKAGSCASDD